MAHFLFLVFLVFGEWVFGLRGSRQCGEPKAGGKIVGGVDSGAYHYPWFALLLLKTNSPRPIPVCAGSLITNTYVLTAAHCFNIKPYIPNADLFSVALGVYDICNDNEGTREIFNVVDVVVHEKYRRRDKFYDIALMKLDRPADYTVICLPLTGVADVTEPALVMGFGVTDEKSDSVPCHMMEVNVTKFSMRECMNTKLPLEDKKEPSVICAGSLRGGIDSCSGDSGGPLLTMTPGGRYVIAGIVSYGYGCGTPQVPGVYTNVGSYIRWIQSKIFRPGSKSPPVVRSRKRTREAQGKPKTLQANINFTVGKISVNASKGGTQISFELGRSEKPAEEGGEPQGEPQGEQPEGGEQEERSKTKPKNLKVSFPN